MNIEKLKYPVGKSQLPGDFDPDTLRGFITSIEQFPEQLVKAVGPLTPTQQSWIYRPEGWTIKQVVHHCADSHMNAFIRFKLATTEQNPTIKPYEEAEWAKQVDYKIPMIHSIKVIEGVHYRWVALLKNMTVIDFEKTFLHPEQNETWSLYRTVAHYDWHCRHHLGHVLQGVKHRGEF